MNLDKPHLYIIVQAAGGGRGGGRDDLISGFRSDAIYFYLLRLLRLPIEGVYI